MNGDVMPQVFTFELCAEVIIEGTGHVEWVTLQPEILTSLKAPRSYANVLFQLPKYLIEPVIHSDGILNLKIKFVQDYMLTASTQYLQTKLHETECFLFNPHLTGDHVSKVLQMLEVPGEMAMKAV